MESDETIEDDIDRPTGSSVQTVQATAENFPESEIVKLMKQFCIDTFNPMGELRGDTRGKIMACLERTNDDVLIRDGLKPDGSVEVDQDEQRLFQEFTDDLRRNVEKMKRLVAEGNVEIIIQGKEVVASIAVRNMGNMKDGRDVYEFTEAVVIPSHRGKGLFTILKESLTKRMRRANPSVPLASVTEKTTIKNYCTSHKWKERDLDFFADIMLKRSDLDPHRRDNIRKWYDDKKTKPGWKGFIDDPGRQ